MNPSEAARAQVALNGIGGPIARLSALPSVLIGNNLQKQAHRKQIRPHSERETGLQRAYFWATLSMQLARTYSTMGRSAANQPTNGLLQNDWWQKNSP